jgi:modulator of FtsH protease HflK
MAERNITPVKLPAWLKPGIVTIAIIVIVVLVLFGTSFYVVDQTEQAVVTTFGKYTGITEPGLHFKLPFGIQQNYNVKTKTVLTEQFGFRTAKSGVAAIYEDKVYPEESTMLTGDLNIVDVEWIIQYRIVDPKAWMFSVNDRSRTIRDVSQAVINMLVGDRTILDVIGPERTAIQVFGAELMNSMFKEFDLGINVIAVQLQNIVPPQGVQAAFEDVNKAIQDMNRAINEGKESYNKEIPKAQGQASQIKQVAEGYASERVNKANGDVSRFAQVYAEYKKSPDITRQRLYFEMVEQVFGDTAGTQLIDKKLSNFLPLKNITSAPAQAPAPKGGENQ